MKRLWNRVVLLKLIYDRKFMRDCIADEEQRYKEYPQRMKAWRREAALIQSAIDRRRGVVSRLSHTIAPLRDRQYR